MIDYDPGIQDSSIKRATKDEGMHKWQMNWDHSEKGKAHMRLDPKNIKRYEEYGGPNQLVNDKPRSLPLIPR